MHGTFINPVNDKPSVIECVTADNIAFLKSYDLTDVFYYKKSQTALAQVNLSLSAEKGEGNMATCKKCGTAVKPWLAGLPQKDNALVCGSCGDIACMVCLAQKATSEGARVLKCIGCDTILRPTQNAYRG